MSHLTRLFTDHPATVGETYGQHAGFAFSVGLRMVLAGLACAVHGLLPFLFQKTGSDCIRQLSEHFGAHGRTNHLPRGHLAAPKP